MNCTNFVDFFMGAGGDPGMDLKTWKGKFSLPALTRFSDPKLPSFPGNAFLELHSQPKKSCGKLFQPTPSSRQKQDHSK